MRQSWMSVFVPTDYSRLGWTALLGVLSMLSNVNSFAQGTIIFANRVVNSVVAPVYGPNPFGGLYEQQFGNTINGYPAGTTVYTGAPLSGTGFTAQLWAAPGANQPEDSLLPARRYSTSVGFDSGARAGLWVRSTDAALIPGAPEGSIATLQVRVWNNEGGTITSWAAAYAAEVPGGASLPFNSLPLGGELSSPYLVGLQSFSIRQVIPEPSTFALGSLAGIMLAVYGHRSRP